MVVSPLPSFRYHRFVIMTVSVGEGFVGCLGVAAADFRLKRIFSVFPSSVVAEARSALFALLQADWFTSLSRRH